MVPILNLTNSTPQHLLQEYVMTKAIKRGIPFYNFLGITGIFDGSDGVLPFQAKFQWLHLFRKMGTFAIILSTTT